MAGYNPNSCNSLQKPYYRPIEVALRWCGLIEHEVEILESVGIELMPGVSMFPKWPCLRVNCEKVIDAMLNGELPYGRDGETVPHGDQVAKHRRTVRHTDLKAWMQSHYPGQKPEFLFDEIERDTHQAISADAFRAIQAKLSASEARIEKAKEAWLSQNEELKKAQAEVARLRSLSDSNNVHPRRRLTYLTLIEALALKALDGDIPAEPYKAAAVLQNILERRGFRLDKDPIANTVKEILAIQEDRTTGKQ